MKYLHWIPIIGIILKLVAIEKGQPYLSDSENAPRFWISAFYHAAAITFILIPFLLS